MDLLLVILINTLIAIFLGYIFKKPKLKGNKIMEDQINIDLLFSVEKFNDWFNTPNNGSYANPGIFLRTDKLSTSIFFDYFTYNYITDVEKKMYGDKFKKFLLFREAVRQDWINRLQNK